MARMIDQHRPSGAGEDRNPTADRVLIDQSPPAPALRGRRGSQHRVAERRLQRQRPASTGPPGPARIATRSWRSSRPGTGPSTGPPGPARIATPGRPAPPRRTPPQHRPSGAGEDRNINRAPVAMAVLDQHRPSGAGEDRNPWLSTWRPSTRSVPAPALRGRRGSQHLAISVSLARRYAASTGPPGPARIATTRTATSSASWTRPAPALRGRRGSQPAIVQHATILACAASTGPPGPARIATGRR